MPIYNYVTLDEPLGIDGTSANGINDAGQIVGGYTDLQFRDHGFLLKAAAPTPPSTDHLAPPPWHWASTPRARSSGITMPAPPLTASFLAGALTPTSTILRPP